MRISSVKITNFRSYKNTTEIKFDDLTVFVGKNDVGKSTILEALDVFFNDKNAYAKIEKDDINKFSDERDVIISVIFDDLPAQISIDETNHTTLQAEHLLNEENKLEIIKKYVNASATPKIFIKAYHPTNPECADLLYKKQNELRNTIRENQIECENQNINAVMRAAIWNHFSESLNLQSIEIDTTKEDAKNIWSKLNVYLPLYSLFQSDRKNSDGDSEVQDPLKEAVKQILAADDIQNQFRIIAERVQDQLREVSGRTLEKLREMDPFIANSLNPQIPSAEDLKWTDVFKSVSITGDSDIPINKRGSGVKRLVLINFFRAEAERRANLIENRGVIYSIEEPETSQHTENQKKIIDSIKTLANRPNSQVILTTHSAYIVKQLNFSNLRLIKKDNNGQRIVENIEQGILNYPSLNEVNFMAFDEINIEHHDELYSYIVLQDWLDEFKRGKPTRSYIQICRDGNTQTRNKILSEYIRDQIHHPENTHNIRYTNEELKQSILLMREFIHSKRDGADIENEN